MGGRHVGGGQVLVVDRLFVIGLRNLHVQLGLLQHVARQFAVMKIANSSVMFLCLIEDRFCRCCLLCCGLSLFVAMSPQQAHALLPSEPPMVAREWVDGSGPKRRP